MLPAKHEIILYQYADFTLGLELNGSDDLPLDLTGYEFFASIRNSPSDLDASLLDFTITVLNQTTNKGAFRLDLTAENIETLPLNSQQDFFWDLKLKRPDGYRSRFMEGTVTVSLGVTHVL